MKRFLLVLTVFLGLLALPSIAVADNTVPDGDGLTPVAANPLAFGNVGCGVETSLNALVAISRNGSATGTNTFHNSAVVTISVQSVTGGVSATLPASPGNQITLPGNWGSLTNNTLSSAITSQVTINSSTPGVGAGSVTYRASGVNADGNAITRDATMDVSWTTGTCAPLDTTPPVIGYTLDPASPDGDNGWYKSDVTLTWDVSEPESPGSLVKTGCVDQSITTDQQETTYSCSATSDGGSAGPIDVKIKRDATAPTISFVDDTPAANGNGWNNTTVSVNWSCADTTSGPVSATVSQSVSTEGADQSTIGTCTDNAGNSSSDTQSGINIDKTPPDVDVTGVADGATYTLGSVPVAGCSTTDELSGVAVAATLSTSGGPLGSVTATCSGAKDNADNTNSASATYSVVFDFHGFFQPLDMDKLNVAKAGSAIPVKFSLSGNQGLAILAMGYPQSTKISCDNSGPLDDVTETVNAGGSSLTYDAVADQYVYVWKTDKSWANTCRRLQVKLIDGTTHTADFKFK